MPHICVTTIYSLHNNRNVHHSGFLINHQSGFIMPAYSHLHNVANIILYSRCIHVYISILQLHEVAIN